MQMFSTQLIAVQQILRPYRRKDSCMASPCMRSVFQLCGLVLYADAFGQFTLTTCLTCEITVAATWEQVVVWSAVSFAVGDSTGAVPRRLPIPDTWRDTAPYATSRVCPGSWWCLTHTWRLIAGVACWLRGVHALECHLQWAVTQGLRHGARTIPEACRGTAPYASSCACSGTLGTVTL